jgi:hypothetical protein
MLLARSNTISMSSNIRSSLLLFPILSFCYIKIVTLRIKRDLQSKQEHKIQSFYAMKGCNVNFLSKTVHSSKHNRVYHNINVAKKKYRHTVVLHLTFINLLTVSAC